MAWGPHKLDSKTGLKDLQKLLHTSSQPWELITALLDNLHGSAN